MESLSNVLRRQPPIDDKLLPARIAGVELLEAIQHIVGRKPGTGLALGYFFGNGESTANLDDAIILLKRKDYGEWKMPGKMRYYPQFTSCVQSINTLDMPSRAWLLNVLEKNQRGFYLFDNDRVLHKMAQVAGEKAWLQWRLCDPQSPGQDEVKPAPARVRI